MEPRGLTVDEPSQRGGVPLGQKSYYGAIGVVWIYRNMGKCPCKEDPVAVKTHHLETEAIPEGEVGAEVSILRTV